MNHHTYFAKARRPVETCLVGTGGFGSSFLAQGLRVPLMRARIAVDRDAEIAAAAMRAVGVDPRRIRLCTTAAEARSAFALGDHIAAGSLEVVIDLDFDVLVEATGMPEAGARHALMAVEAGKHVALVSKEVDIVVGPILARLAAEKGKVVTPVDGDQPSLLIGLVTWAETLGFEILAAGKSSEYDFIVDRASGVVASNGREVRCPELARHWELGARDATELAAARSAAAAALPQRAVPDLCELGVVANSTDLMPDRADFHAPIARIAEVPTLFSTRARGGLLDGTGRLDVFHCLREAHEPSFAGGVFVVIACDHAPTWEMLAGKGHVMSRDGLAAMAYLPRHLLGLEAATSVLDAAINGVSTGGVSPRPRFDLMARAERALPAGATLAMGGHHHAIDGVAGELLPAVPLAEGAPVPFYIAANQRLARDVAAGALITLGDLALAEPSPIMTLRQRQDAAFFGAATAERKTVTAG